MHRGVSDNNNANDMFSRSVVRSLTKEFPDKEFSAAFLEKIRRTALEFSSGSRKVQVDAKVYGVGISEIKPGCIEVFGKPTIRVKMPGKTNKQVPVTLPGLAQFINITGTPPNDEDPRATLQTDENKAPSTSK